MQNISERAKILSAKTSMQGIKSRLKFLFFCTICIALAILIKYDTIITKNQYSNYHNYYYYYIYNIIVIMTDYFIDFHNFQVT